MAYQSSIQKILITSKSFKKIGKQSSLPLTVICLCKLKATTIRREVRKEESQNSFVGHTRDSLKFTLLHIGLSSQHSQSPLKCLLGSSNAQSSTDVCISHHHHITLQSNLLKITMIISYRIWKICCVLQD